MIPFAVLNLLVSDVKKRSLRVNSVMILVVLSTHVELTSATARGRSYWETGQFNLSNSLYTKSIVTGDRLKAFVPTSLLLLYSLKTSDSVLNLFLARGNLLTNVEAMDV